MTFPFCPSFAGHERRRIIIISPRIGKQFTEGVPVSYKMGDASHRAKPHFAMHTHPHMHCRWCSHHQATESNRKGSETLKRLEFGPRDEGGRELAAAAHNKPRELPKVASLSFFKRKRGRGGSIRFAPHPQTHCRWCSHYQAIQSAILPKLLIIESTQI